MTSTARNLFIVATTKAHIYTPLRRAFEGQTEVDVLLDRRRGERRRVLDPAAVPHGAERRRRERRVQTDAQGRLARIGLMLVETTAPAFVMSPAVDFRQGRLRAS